MRNEEAFHHARENYSREAIEDARPYQWTTKPTVTVWVNVYHALYEPGRFYLSQSHTSEEAATASLWKAKERFIATIKVEIPKP